jgi:hypothetical protein
MRLAEFESNLAAYGTDLARLPAQIREPAMLLIANSDKARALLRAEHRLDALFADAIPPAPEAASIVHRITASPQTRPVSLLVRLLRPGETMFSRARIAVLASCLGVGLLVGIFSAHSSRESNVLDLIDGSAFEVNDE